MRLGVSCERTGKVCSRNGVTRCGSRKNKAHQIVKTVPIQPSGVQIQKKMRLASAKPPMKG